jgi:hypothetical protein
MSAKDESAQCLVVIAVIFVNDDHGSGVEEGNRYG